MKPVLWAVAFVVAFLGCGGETAPSSSGAAASECRDEQFREDLYPHVECTPGAHLSRDADAGIVLCRCTDLH